MVSKGKNVSGSIVIPMKPALVSLREHYSVARLYVSAFYIRPMLKDYAFNSLTTKRVHFPITPGLFQRAMSRGILLPLMRKHLSRLIRICAAFPLQTMRYV